MQFITTAASLQNSFDLYKDWVCRIPVAGTKTGSMLLFEHDDIRPQQVVDAFGPIANWKVLDLGSFEAPHTYQLERMGAEVTGIEANPDLFIKSLIVKNALGLRAQFLLGDFSEFLSTTTDRYDLIFASGVIYHMKDPVGLIDLMSKRTDRIFIWGHYVPEEVAKNWAPALVFEHQQNGRTYRYFRYIYPERADRAYAGTESYCSRITKDDMMGALRAAGFEKIQVVRDHLDHPGGPAVTLAAERTTAS